MPDDTEKLLAERATTHGEYTEHARLTQGTLDLWMTGRNWGRLTPIQRETLHMWAHKVGRILEGDPNHPDHWDDVAGYAVLVSQRLGTSEVTYRFNDPKGNEAEVRVPVHAVGDAKPVPIEDSSRHADRAERLTEPELRKQLTKYEYNQLPIHQRVHYDWVPEHMAWELKK